MVVIHVNRRLFGIAGMASAVVKEFDDLNRLEREVNEALQRASQGKYVPNPISLASLPLPATPLTEKATTFAKSCLDSSVFLHSLRSYFFGTALAVQSIPEFKWNPHTAYLAAMLHDVGLSSRAIHETSLSFEFHGGMVGRDFLMREGASAHESDTVAEAIMRHTEDLTATAFDAYGHSPECVLLILGTHLDVYGAFGALIHSDTIAETVATYPRSNFNNAFADLLMEEHEVKRFCKVAKRVGEGFLDKVRNNAVFSKYDS